MAFVDRWYARGREGVLALSEAALAATREGPPRATTGRFPFADAVLHVNAEVVEHGAEAALLRDLCRAAGRP